MLVCLWFKKKKFWEGIDSDFVGFFLLAVLAEVELLGSEDSYNGHFSHPY